MIPVPIHHQIEQYMASSTLSSRLREYESGDPPKPAKVRKPKSAKVRKVGASLDAGILDAMRAAGRPVKSKEVWLMLGGLDTGFSHRCVHDRLIRCYDIGKISGRVIPSPTGPTRIFFLHP